MDCAMAGLATAVAAAAKPAARRNCRRFIAGSFLNLSAADAARAQHVRSSSPKLKTSALVADREATRPLPLAKGGAHEASRRRSRGRLALRPCSGADHEAVVGIFRHLPPQNLVVAEC